MHTRNRVIGVPLLAGLALVATSAFAEMQPMSEKEMGKVTGQAMLGLDVNQTAQADFTRFTIGSRSEFQMNMRELSLGNTGDGTDIEVNNLSFGHIDRDTNEIVPFVGLDPYLEMAENGGDVIGFRMGFTESKGSLSGKFETLSGRMGIEFEDSEGNVQQGQFLDSDGNPKSKRAEYYGVPAGDCDTPENCPAQSAPLSAFETVDVGDRASDGSAEFTNDFFISFQNQAVEWQSPGDGTGTVSTESGVFINIPTSMRMDIQALQNETVAPRQRTEYIDRGQGLF